MHFTSAARAQNQPDHEPNQCPYKGKDHERYANERCGHRDPNLEANLLAAEAEGYRRGDDQAEEEYHIENERDQHTWHADEFAKHHKMTCPPVAKFLLKLHAADRIRRIVMPANVLKLSSADPAPICLAASASHVVAA
mmetsp:Transcript_121741/g.211307  ORF Transcript_121741/g.211307 Transcript_121741/m.211307 type:complete len:138 (-) Transcript_121741:14-427(-)